ncbi:hypothetical protein E6H35_02765 [Candidatus Bathyarchaeota archaeon]|nr:MAG: hypothetical protein E6H35_02765 [Candidatus Bathyarchaeota archaeon]
MRRTRAAFGLIVFLLLVMGFSLPYQTPFPDSILLSGVLAATIAVLLSLFPENIRQLMLGKKQPTVSLEPLQILHFGAGAKPERSQWINMIWTSSGTPQHTLTALFGVIRAHAIGGDAIGCRASAKLKMHDIWLDSGNLNWYSSSLIRNLTTLPDFELLRLSTYLTNITEHIPKDDAKDLLVFYMLQNGSGVFLCSDMTHSFAGNVQNDQPLRFQLEISITAQHQPKVVTFFDVEATWGRFLIAKASQLPVSAN